MWFNSMQREEPYLGLKGKILDDESRLPARGLVQVLHGCRQLVP
jgi:hypothetical protein